MFGIKQTRKKNLTEKERENKMQEYRDYQKILHPPRKQKGGSWFDGLSQGMFGVKRTKGKKKRPQVTHNQKGGVLGLDRFSSYYNGKSKKEQQEMDNWAARNL
jgi:hypothetical protein